MDSTVDTQHAAEPLVELAPDETVVRALAQTSHPVDWVESNQSDEEVPESDGS